MVASCTMQLQLSFLLMKPVQGLSQGSPKETLVSSHLDALCFSPYQQLNDIPYPSLPHYSQKSAPSPLSRLGGGGHISSDWQQQQLQLRGDRTAADSRWPQHMNQLPPISQSQSEPKAKITHEKPETMQRYWRVTEGWWYFEVLRQYFLLIQNHLQPDTAILLLGADFIMQFITYAH